MGGGPIKYPIFLFCPSKYEIVPLQFNDVRNKPDRFLPRCRKILRAKWDASKLEFLEEFKVTPSNRANRVLGIVNVPSGGTSGTVVDLKLIFAADMKASASSVLIAHNHQGGTLKPSGRGVKVTEEWVKAGHLLDLPEMDHITITAEGYCSFADMGGL